MPTRLRNRLRNRIRRFVAGLVICCAAAAAHAADDAPLPVEAFYRNPDLQAVALSPSGKRLALSSSFGAERVALAVFDLDSDAPPRRIAAFQDIDIDAFHWVDEDHLVFDITDRTRAGGNQRYGSGLYSIAADGRELRQLVRLRNDLVVTDRVARRALDWSHGLLAVPEGGGSEVIVGRYVRDANGDLDTILPIRLDITTLQTRTLALDAPEHAAHWWFDPKGQPRVVYSRREGKGTLLWREGTAWKQIASGDLLDMPFEVHSVDGQGQLFVTMPRGAAGQAALYRFDFATGKPEPEPLVSAPGFDFRGSLVTAYGEGRALGVRLTTDAQTAVWFDAKMKQAQQAVDRKLPGRINRLSCRRCGADDMVVLVRSWSDRQPGEFHVYRPGKNEWQPVGAVRRDVDARRMATLDLHRIQARDGLELPVWVTQPPGPPARRPAVVLVHGGPWVRGAEWAWRADAQFLASRGYVVIEPEFRGSTGYGDRHFRAGFKQWGTSMQDDLIDAVNWAAGKGFVDASRVCLYGGSYGGYATLMSLARHPEAYRCGVAFAAVTDPRLMFGLRALTDISEESRRFTLPTMIGDPIADAAMLAAAAPVEQAAKIKAPVLLAHGVEDVRVPIEHAQRMRAALQDAGNAPEWVVYPGEAHGWYQQANRYDFARRVEAFLARNLK